MAIENLSLEELDELEAQHPPMVGCRTSVFLEPHERVAGQIARGQTGRKLSDDILSKVAAANGISKHQASRIFATLEELASSNPEIAMMMQALEDVPLPVQKAKPLKHRAPKPSASSQQKKTLAG